MKLCVAVCAAVLLAPALARAQAPAAYVGSATCRTCHTEIYDRWQKTLMANVVRDPHEHPEAILPDFSKADPAVVKFSVPDVALVYGTRWKQRYFKRVDGDYYPFLRNGT